MATDAPPPDLRHLLGPAARRSPDMEKVWAWLSTENAGVPNWLDLPPAEARRLTDGLMARWNAELPSVVAVEPLVLPGSPPVLCHLVTPPAAEPGCLLFLHGGGWSFGNLETYGRFTRLLALATRRRVLVPGYRLAPEHPFPAPFEDCRAAWRWLAREGREMARGGPLAIAGDSAGANLALAVTVDALRQDQALPDRGLLFYGAFARNTDTPSYLRFADGFGLTRAGMVRFWQYYVPADLDSSDPRVAPGNMAETLLQRLPPLYLNAAGLDPLLCDTLNLANRLRAAGVHHELMVHEGVHHGFMQMSLRLPDAQRAIDRVAAFLHARA